MDEKSVGVNKTEGIILKKSEMSDTDRLLTVYTQKFGKILVRAKGVGKRESKLKSLIEPFNLYEFMLARPVRGDTSNGARSRNIDVLANSYLIKEFLYLRQNLENLALAIYFAELADKLIVAPEEDYKVWALITCVMEALNEQRADLKKIKTAFEEKLLEFLGHPSTFAQGKSSGRQRLHYFQSLAGDEIKSERFLRSLSLTS